MIYQKYKPCDELTPFVECYFVWESEKAVDNFVVESPPNGFCSIVFNLGDEYFLQNKKYEKLAVPREFIAGQSIYCYKLFLTGNISMNGIVFKPAALATLFGLPTYEYTEERVPLQTVFQPALIKTLTSKLKSAETTNDKVRHLEQFLMITYNQDRPKPDYIDIAANSILEKNGMGNVADLMKDVFMSRRNFERKFFNKVGLSPKYYAKVRRLAFLMNRIAGRKTADWLSLLSECGYYDQSHFIKDFIEFTGRTPQQYLNENAELANIIEKPKTKDIL